VGENARPDALRPPVSSSLRLIVVLNEKLLEVMGDDVTQDQAFAHANDVLRNAVGGISDIPGLVNVDFEDVKTVMSEPGKAMMGTAVAGGPDRATKAAQAAVACPLLADIDLSGARGVLVLIAANKATFKLSESPSSTTTWSAQGRGAAAAPSKVFTTNVLAIHDFHRALADDGPANGRHHGLNQVAKRTTHAHR